MKKHIICISLVFVLFFFFPSVVRAEFQQNFDFYSFLKSGGEYLMDYKLEQMSLAEKVGQLFQIGFTGFEPDAAIEDMIKNHYVGGVIYFSRNIKNPEQTARLSNQLQELALSSGTGLPLFISTDQEGGVVTRIKGATHFPSNMALGAADDKELTNKIGKAVGSELKNLGINFNLAPVLDVNNNPDNPVIGVRSFGGDPKLVAKLGKAYINGIQSEGIIATAKHFPGHGDTDTDSHLELPIIKHGKQRLNEVELYPFKKAVKTGVESIMTAHVYFPAFEKKDGIPATLSESVLTDLLRKKMNFKGLIITDCMEMKAIADNFGTAEGAVRTIEAGSDIVLVSHTYTEQKKAVKAVIEAVRSGRISEKRIDKSVKRIIKSKAKNLNPANLTKASAENIDFEAHQKIAAKTAKKAVTEVKNQDILPIKNIENKKITVVDFKMKKESLAEDSEQSKNYFVESLKEDLNNIKHLSFSRAPRLEKYEDDISGSDLVIVCTSNAASNREQALLANKLAEDYQVLVLALRNPYDYKYVDNVQAFITVYDYSPFNQKAAADYILGKIKAEGKLPVKIN
mgnify:CR=1 FL=1